MSNLYYEELYLEDGNENSGEDGPAKSQVQWKMFAIVYAHLKYGKELPSWWGVRGPDHTIPNFQNIVDGATIDEIKMKLKTPVPWRSLPCALTKPNDGHKGVDTCAEEDFSDFIDKAPPDFKKELEKYGSGEYAKDKDGGAKRTKKLAKDLGQDAGEKMGQAVKDKGLSGKNTDGNKKPGKSSKIGKLPIDKEKIAAKIRAHQKNKQDKSPYSSKDTTPAKSKKGGDKSTTKKTKSPNKKGRSSLGSRKAHKKLGFKGKPSKRNYYNNIQHWLSSISNINNKRKVSNAMRKLGFTQAHVDAAKKGSWETAGIKSGSKLANNLIKLGIINPPKNKKSKKKKPQSRMYRNESINIIKDIIREEINDAMSSTERMRRYNKKHPEKVSKHLKDTTSDRVERNRAHREATQKHGESYMKDKDVHHPDGVNGGKTMVVGQDHGRDKKPNKKESSDSNKVVGVKGNMNQSDLKSLIKYVLFNVFNNGK